MSPPIPEHHPPPPGASPNRPPVALFHLDRTGSIQQVGRATDAFLPDPPTDCVGRSIGSVLPNPIGRDTMDCVEQSVKEWAPITLVSFHPTSQQWVDGIVDPQTHDITARFFDSTGRKQCEQLLHAIDVPVLSGLVRIDLAGTIRDANDRLAQLLGYKDASRLKGRSVADLFAHERDWTQLREACMDRGRVGPVSRPYARKDGTRATGRTRVTPVRDAKNLLRAFDLTVTPNESRERPLNEERMIQQAVQSTTSAVLVTDAKPVAPPGPPIVYVNSSFSTLTGYATEDVVGRSPKFLCGPNTDVEVLTSLRDHLQRGSPYRGELIAYKKNGTPYVGEWSVAPIRNDQGTITHWISVHREVTSDRNAEAIRPPQESDAEALYGEMGDLLDASTWEDVASELVSLTTETIGLSDALVRQKSNKHLVPIARGSSPGSASTVTVTSNHPAARALRANGTVATDGQTHLALGSHGTLSVNVDGASGKRPIQVLEILSAHATRILDRLAQAAAERTAHRRSEALRAASLELLESSTVVDGIEGAFSSVRPLFPEDTRLRLLIFGPNDETARVLAANEVPLANLERNHVWPLDAGLQQLVDTDGMTLVDCLTAAPTQTRLERRLYEGGCRSYLAIPVTLKNRRAVLIAATQTASTLAPAHSKVVEELGDLFSSVSVDADATETQPDDITREETTDLRTALLANVHHELRTPLTSIIGFAEVISQQGDGLTGRFADLIAQSGRRLTKTFEALLTLSRFEAGTMPIDSSPLSVSAELDAAVEGVVDRAREADLTLHYKAPETSINAELDPNGLRDIVHHLLDNAIKFTEPGGTIRVTLDGTENHVVLSVADSGIGMEPSQVPAMFSSFQQASARLDRAHDGAGLGLALVKNWVDALGGSVDVDTDLGEGTTISVRLPRT